MRWPWSVNDDDDEKKSGLPLWTAPTKSTGFAGSWTEPRTLIPSLALTASMVAALRFYKAYLRRIPTVNHIKPDYFRRRSLFGQVTSVGDADNFRLYHTPGGRIAGWGWLPWKRVPTTKEALAQQTVSLNRVLSPNCTVLGLHAIRYITNWTNSFIYASLEWTRLNLRTGAERLSLLQRKPKTGSSALFTIVEYAHTYIGVTSTTVW